MNHSLKDSVWGTLASYRSSASRATTAIISNWIIIPASILLIYFFNFLSGLFWGTMTGRFLIGMLEIVCISVYYCWLKDSVRKDKITVKNITDIDWSLFISVLNTSFVLWLPSLFIGQVTWLQAMYRFALVIVCNALPEIIYLQRSEGMSAVTDSERFTRTNWIEWYAPYIIALLPLFMLSTEGTLYLMSQMEVMLPATVIFQSVQVLARLLSLSGTFVSLLVSVLAIIAVNWFMVFRGFLFQELSTGSRRQRAFRSKL